MTPRRLPPIEPEDPSWHDLDDTLADGPAPASLPDAARPWLAEQRLLHGLLRALHTADAAAREGRIAAILGRIDGARAPRRWWLVAAAATVFASLGVWLALPARLPTAEAAMDRAVAELGRDVDRRFRVELAATTASGKELRNELLLVTRPGTRFRIDGKLAFGGVPLGEFRIGCDGQELWLLPANGAFRRAGPLADHERLLQGLGDLLDLGYLDVHGLVRRLPQDLDLRVAGRERTPGGSQLRIEAVRRPTATDRLRSAWLACDEATGMVTHIETEVDIGRGLTRRLTLHYLGEEPPGLVDYRRPW
ncbi:MAG: hypothetical protein KF830_14545 [Planctomycetes bacterium]|nr:hypothetical protein [Planctomycetota bacterium]